MKTKLLEEAMQLRDELIKQETENYDLKAKLGKLNRNKKLLLVAILISSLALAVLLYYSGYMQGFNDGVQGLTNFITTRSIIL